VQVLNALGVEPQVLPDERCCGHDLLWEGDLEGFRTLAELNAKLIHHSGAKRIVTACPECARALKVDYPAHGIKLNVEILHLIQLLAEREQSLPLANTAARTPQHVTRITYQDPCRLGRHMGVYDAPRQVIHALGLELVEMQRHGRNALCCGTNGWSHCAIANKAIQVDRLHEASATGADLLVTACIKCQIHFKCAMQDQLLADEIPMEVTDLATLVAERLEDGTETAPTGP
jgi:Fe-S oxidoreductase